MTGDDEGTRTLTVYVPGTPAPQGSKRHVGNGRMIESSPALAPWRDEIVVRIRSMMNRTAHPGYGHGVAVDVVARFYLRRPRTVRRAEPTVTPDLDKLVRAMFDAMTLAYLVHDDAQVVRLSASKHYAVNSRPTGVLIHVRPHG